MPSAFRLTAPPALCHNAIMPGKNWYRYHIYKKQSRRADDFAGGRCVACGFVSLAVTKAGSDHIQTHHITPRKDGGRHTDDNLIRLCRPCHEIFERLPEATQRGFKASEVWALNEIAQLIPRRVPHATLEASPELVQAATPTGHDVPQSVHDLFNSTAPVKYQKKPKSDEELDPS